MKVVVDASMTLSWFFRDERDELAAAALTYVRDNGAIVPSLWAIEIVHVLVRAERRGRMTEERTARALDYLRRLPFVVDVLSETATFPYAAYMRRFHLSAYDAAYLELAVRHGVHLATRDQTLADAAAALGLLWASPSDR